MEQEEDSIQVRLPLGAEKVKELRAVAAAELRSVSAQVSLYVLEAMARRQPVVVSKEKK